MQWVYLQVGLKSGSEAETTYKTLLSKIPGGPEVLENAYNAVIHIVVDVRGYVNVSYQ